MFFFSESVNSFFKGIFRSLALELDHFALFRSSRLTFTLLLRFFFCLSLDVPAPTALVWWPLLLA